MVTVTGAEPVVPTGTDVVILVLVLLVTTAVVPLKLTILFAGVALKFVPVIVTLVPGMPEEGEKEVMVGAKPQRTVKLDALVPVLPATVTVIVPVVAPVGTVVVIDVAVLAVTTAVVPLNFTILFAGVVLKFVPVIVTVVPTTPVAGVKDEMVGTGPPNSASPVIVHVYVMSSEVLGTCPVVV
jgi:hypothetical protein